jgi:hypothetical protein
MPTKPQTANLPNKRRLLRMGKLSLFLKRLASSLPASKLITAIQTVDAETKPAQALDDEKREFAIQGRCGYLAFRRFIIKAAYPQASRDLSRNPNLLIEREGTPNGKIHVEATGKKTLYELPNSDGANVVEVKYVLGVIYTSKNGLSRIMWRKPDRLWGKASPQTISLFECCGIYLSTIEAGLGHPA